MKGHFGACSFRTWKTRLRRIGTTHTPASSATGSLKSCMIEHCAPAWLLGDRRTSVTLKEMSSVCCRKHHQDFGRRKNARRPEGGRPNERQLYYPIKNKKSKRFMRLWVVSLKGRADKGAGDGSGNALANLGGSIPCSRAIVTVRVLKMQRIKNCA